jgi:hypothetical protein
LIQSNLILKYHRSHILILMVLHQFLQCQSIQSTTIQKDNQDTIKIQSRDNQCAIDIWSRIDWSIEQIYERKEAIDYSDSNQDG